MIGDTWIVPPELYSKPASNADADVKSIVSRVVAVEDQIDAQNKLKALIYAEAKVSGMDIGAIKSVVRAVRYLPQSNAENLSGLSETVKRYLDLVTSRGGAK
jgi:uncharacterized protein (UPF0335 family)